MDPGEDLLDGKYEILEKLGEGGMGAVYKVRHRLLEELRVVKVMRSALQEDPELSARFLREARAASQLRHPNIAQLYDFSVGQDGVGYIVMELIEGVALDKLLRRRGPLPVALVLEIARQALRALDYLHRRQFVHRDISPDNLMLARDVDDEPLIKLIDLGIAKALQAEGGLTVTGMFLGKMRYSSPEQLDGVTGAIDGRSDLYSFGIVLYELLTGSSPIEGTTPPSMIAGHLFKPPIGFEQTDPEGRVPLELRQVVMQALAKKREERMESAEAFAQQLAPIARDFPLTEAVLGEAWSEFAQVHTPAETTRSGGSTQRRLDRHFPAAAVTPKPATVPVILGTEPDYPAYAPTLRLEPKGEVTAKATPLVPPALSQPQAPEATGRRGRVWMLGVGAVVMLVAIFGLLAVLRPSGPSIEPAVELHGTVVLSAIPWAQVTQVRDRSGKTWPLPAEAFTPLVLSLPPGEYVIELHNDRLAPARTLEVDVKAGEITRQVAGFSEVATDEFFKSVGW